MVGEQPYKSRDMVGSDSGLGHLLVILKALFYSRSYLPSIDQFDAIMFHLRDINDGLIELPGDFFLVQNFDRD